MWARLAGIVTVLALPVVAAAQVSTGAANPVYHGGLEIRPAHGIINQTTGAASFAAGPWTLSPVNESNGVFPAQEAIVIALGEENFRLEPGMVKASRNGRRFSYRAPKGLTRGVRWLRIRLQRDGSYAFRFALRNVDLSRMRISDPVCVPMALIVGDDDGFTGVDLTSSGFTRRLTVRGACDIGDQWPWIR
jgi:hypothetical protein